MTIPLPPSPADIADTLDSLIDLLAVSAKAVSAGEIVDLAGLEGEVKPILDAALSLPPAEARGLLPRLETLAASLEQVSQSLKDHHGDLGTETHANRIRAAAAYRPRD